MTSTEDAEIRAAYAELPELRDCWCPLAYAAHRLVTARGVDRAAEHLAAHQVHIAAARAGRHEHVSFDQHRAAAAAAPRTCTGLGYIKVYPFGRGGEGAGIGIGGRID